MIGQEFILASFKSYSKEEIGIQYSRSNGRTKRGRPPIGYSFTYFLEDKDIKKLTEKIRHPRGNPYSIIRETNRDNDSRNIGVSDNQPGHLKTGQTNS
jgi:hypothetical protein